MRSTHRSTLSFPRLAGALFAVALGALATIPANAYALPVGTDEEARIAEESAPSWETLEAGAVDFTAIVALSNCSGSLVRFTSSKTTDSAMVLTNGHCLSGFVPAGTAIVDVSSSRTFTLLTSRGRTLGTLKAQRMMYGTMTGSDFAIYKLTQTYADIARIYGVTALPISDKRPSVGTAVNIVSGFWKRIYSCNIDHFVNELREGTWTFRDSIRFTQPGCETIGGTSGSPIISADTHEVIGINNTGNESGARCTLNNPCEVDAMGTVTFEKGAAYGQQLYQIYGCLDAANKIDLNQMGCTLQKPK